MNQPYPRLPEFNYHRPKTQEEALDLLEKYPDQSRLYAGGTDCFVQIRDRRYLPEHMIDLKSVAGLDTITFDKKEGLTVGATSNMNTLIKHSDVIANYPVLVDSAIEVAGYQLRTRATVVGNLCNASPCGDMIGPCLVYGGCMHILNKAGERVVDLKEFFTGPGKTILKPGEIVTAISFPVPKEGTSGVYKSIGRNKLGDLAITAVTVLGYPDKDCTSGYAFHITLTAVAPTVIFAADAEKTLHEEKLSTGVLDRAAKFCSDGCKPISDIRGSAEYRKDMIRVLAKRGLVETCKKLGISL